jgi:putative flavoprotein involved in K+ transport
MDEIDVLVIGAGQAGLAMGYHLQQHKKSFVILGKEERLGDVWRKRYDSLVLFTPRWFSALPGLPLTGDRDGYATKDEIADYMESYAAHHQLPVDLRTEILSLEKSNGMFHAVTNRGEYRACNVVVATGPFQKPFVPDIAKKVSDRVYQVHTSQYRNPSQLNPGSVLVVGAGNSGAQIAVELSGERKVYLSCSHPLKFFPLQKWGRSIFWWFEKFGILHADAEGKIGRWIRKRNDPIFGLKLRQLLQQGKIGLKSRTADIKGELVTFEDTSVLVLVDNIIWATGFRTDYGWLKVANVLNRNGQPVHRLGESPAEGLYFLGLPWQQTRGSALVGGVGRDAQYLAKKIAKLI